MDQCVSPTAYMMGAVDFTTRACTRTSACSGEQLLTIRLSLSINVTHSVERQRVERKAAQSPHAAAATPTGGRFAGSTHHINYRSDARIHGRLIRLDTKKERCAAARCGGTGDTGELAAVHWTSVLETHRLTYTQRRSLNGDASCQHSERKTGCSSRTGVHPHGMCCTLGPTRTVTIAFL
ncbi:hypothetical protein EXIGLDRAFT_481693 [Exidia glandulosa HHB12029]|uniref:Uncharacterized protein n=1 Tax=Exidia glandulosa HHB12029 TaxID=1314781 RepID=A0A166BLA5_EXIGL|nr:hypothetical protein EXIGLDRAFT_481693 [Exidia glandulosa HHB12029]